MGERKQDGGFNADEVWMKIIDAEWEELPPAPTPELKANREVELTVNLILLGAICKLIYTAFYWASLLR